MLMFALGGINPRIKMRSESLRDRCHFLRRDQKGRKYSTSNYKVVGCMPQEAKGLWEAEAA